ncbi:hypothetical protein JCM21900_004936 [Sporobolomyces salmonicolor]
MNQSDLESLLATLRQAQDSPAPPTPAAPTSAPAPPAPPSQSDLDALLSSLTAITDASTPATHTPTPPPPSAPVPTRTRDLSHLTFPESLPVLHSLALDRQFLDGLEGVWDEQKNWELRMKDERNRFEGELKRSGLSPQLRTLKLKEWDRSAKRKWEALQASQRQQLQAMGVPTFQVTTDPTILKRQERVLKVLVGFLEDRDDGE